MIDLKELSHRIIGAAMRVHSYFGPGFLEEVYQNALAVELRDGGLKVEREVEIPVDYRGIQVGDYKADLIVEGRIILELKAVALLVARHEAQLVNYLSATRIDDGLLLNFGSPPLQFKHKYRLPQTGNPVNPVNPVKRERGVVVFPDRINRIDRMAGKPTGGNPVDPANKGPGGIGDR